MKFSNKLLCILLLWLFASTGEIFAGLEALKNQFSDIVLIINFNHPYYANISFLKELYCPVFDNILFYGEKEDKEVIKVQTNTGYLLSPVIQDACTRFPDAKGYLFLQDDCVLNFWNFATLDTKKIWYAVKFNDGISSNNRFYSVSTLQGYITGGYQWDKWYYNCGLSAAAGAYNQLSKKELAVIKSNVGANTITANMCEVFYIPANFKHNFLRLSDIFKGVFCEIAVPTMLCCLDSISNWEHLDMFGGAGVGLGTPESNTLSNYPTQVSWVHPVKFSYPENRERILAIVKNILDDNK